MPNYARLARARARGNLGGLSVLVAMGGSNGALDSVGLLILKHRAIHLKAFTHDLAAAWANLLALHPHNRR